MRFRYLLCLLSSTLLAAPPETLPGSARWAFPQDIAAEQYREMRDFYEPQNAAAAGLVLVVMTVSMNAVAIWIRAHYRKRIKW